MRPPRTAPPPPRGSEDDPPERAARYVARRFDLPLHLAVVVAREAGLGGAA